MSDNSNIEWTDATWNPVRGCVKVSPGCANCYAETFAERWRGVPGHPYEQGFDLRLVPEKLTEPLKWKKPKRIFVNSMSDLFQDGVPDTYIMDVFLTMEKCPQHTFQVLTKRADRMRTVVSWLARKWADAGDVFPLPNFWLGVSVENQHFADERIPLLLDTPAAVRFISAEPLLGLVDIKEHLTGDSTGHETGGPAGWQTGPALDWVIVGGESGHGARPLHVAWVESILKQCRAARVATFVKQLGAVPLVSACRQQHWEWRHIQREEHKRLIAHSEGLWRVQLTDRKGGYPSEWPEHLRVRQFPQGTDR